MTEIADEFRRSILRKEFYMDVLNCDPMSFDKKCELTNPSKSFFTVADPFSVKIRITSFSDISLSSFL